MADLEFEIEALSKLLRGLDQLSEDLQDRLYNTAERAIFLLAREIKQKWPVDTGRSRASFTNEVKTIGGELVASVGSNVKYAPVIEVGRRPGARMPPVTLIEEWAARHGMAGMGFVIARTIARRGIPAKNIIQTVAKEKAE